MTDELPEPSPTIPVEWVPIDREKPPDPGYYIVSVRTTSRPIILMTHYNPATDQWSPSKIAPGWSTKITHWLRDILPPQEDTA